MKVDHIHFYTHLGNCCRWCLVTSHMVKAKMIWNHCWQPSHGSISTTFQFTRNRPNAQSHISVFFMSFFKTVIDSLSQTHDCHCDEYKPIIKTNMQWRGVLWLVRIDVRGFLFCFFVFEWWMVFSVSRCWMPSERDITIVTTQVPLSRDM